MTPSLSHCTYLLHSFSFCAYVSFLDGSPGPDDQSISGLLCIDVLTRLSSAVYIVSLHFLSLCCTLVSYGTDPLPNGIGPEPRILVSCLSLPV